MAAAQRAAARSAADASASGTSAGAPAMGAQVLAIRIRGTVNMRGSVEDTLTMLRLHRPNAATIIPMDASYRGMILKVKDWIAFGEVDAETATELLAKRGRLEGDKPITDEFVNKATAGRFATVAAFGAALANGEAKLKDLGEDAKPFFRLHPPRGGHDGDVKHHAKVGGALGYYGPKINALARRMM